ncbi:MAG: nucleotidyltransferase family protein [Oscillospiraceae bacterium]|nr:nucleotidyltransferase family protein [Oscillospiraceae bacterium]
MKTVGIICEYNPFHLGHAGHIEKTKAAVGGDAFIICVMSGNFVQRGDFAVFNKHSRAKMAVLCGADVVIELPTPYALLSAGGFAKAGVYLLDSLGVCDYLSFGSEQGSIDCLKTAAQVISSDEAQIYIKDGLSTGISYAAAQQQAADALLGEKASIFQTPNNTLAIEYIKALDELNSKMKPITVFRTGGEHDSDIGYSASALRKAFLQGNIPITQMPGAAVAVCMEESLRGFGPVSIKNAEQGILSRLRGVEDFSQIPGGADGLDRRFLRYAKTLPTVSLITQSIKTKRFAMSRIRRMLMNSVLGIKNEDIKNPPPYIRLLAMNQRGTEILKKARKKTNLPIITKPASVYKQNKQAVRLFNLEAAATDFYALAYDKAENRTGGGEWTHSPIVL